MEPLFHLILPLLILLFFFPKLDKNLVFKLAIFSIVMDLDSFIPGMHRILFHNIFFVLIVFLIVYYLKGKLAGLISLYFLISHLILDLGMYGISIFSPFYNKFIYFVCNFRLDSGRYIFDIGFSTERLEILSIFKTSYYLTEVGSLILVLLIIMLFVKIYTKKKLSN